jgi:hypothetical protein
VYSIFPSALQQRGQSWKKLIQIRIKQTRKRTTQSAFGVHMHKMLLTTVQLRKCFIYWISSSSVAAQNVFCGERERAEYKWVTVCVCVREENFSKEYQMIHDEYQIWHSPPTARGWRYLFILFGLADGAEHTGRVEYYYICFLYCRCPAIHSASSVRVCSARSVYFLIFL